MSRFNLLLLDHGELLLESALCSMKAESEEELEGRLWLATRSIFFEPKFLETRPITRYLFKPMTFEPIQDVAANAIILKAKKWIEIRKSQPYHQNEFSTLSSIVFNLKHTKASKLLGLLKDLWKISQKCHPNDDAEELLLKSIIDPRLVEPFDRSRLVDFREINIYPARPEIVVSVEKVEPLVNVPGVLLLTRERIYFQHVRCNNLSGSRQTIIWTISEIQAASKRRYMMQQRGLELKFTGDRQILLIFRDGREIRDEFYSQLIGLIPSYLRASTEARLEESTFKWQKREIDNFTYLEILNEEADRSKNDLTQYPVYPWILADYESLELDFSNPSTFRDLSKPIGALEPNRRKQFLDRYELMKDSDDPPPFLYGTHYSTPGFVLFFLIRQRRFFAFLIKS